MEQATPLKSAGPSPASAIDDDVSALLAGQPELRNLQKLALFSTSHPIEIPEDADEEDIAEARQVWEDNRLFVRIFEGLVAYLDASKVSRADGWTHALRKFCASLDDSAD
jgi:CLIP-associating protein 1/2